LKNQDKEEGGTWSLAGVEALQAGHGLRGPIVTDFESYLTRVETIAAGTKIASAITLMKSRVTATKALDTYDMQGGTLSYKKLMALHCKVFAGKDSPDRLFHKNAWHHLFYLRAILLALELSNK